MSQLRTKNYVKRDVIGSGIRKRLQDLQSGTRIIEAHLNVLPGHDYWWFLEYGTGPYYSVDGELGQPKGTLGFDPAGGPYQITVRPENRDKKTTYQRGTKNGVITVEQPFKLSYISSGERKYALTVLHPGVKASAFVRTSLMKAMLIMETRLNQLTDSNDKEFDAYIPLRKELVELVNEVMGDALTILISNTPDDSDPDDNHEDRPHTPTLAESWSITKAR